MKRGASLVEVILAVSLIGLVLVSLLGLLPSTVLMEQQAEHQVAATNFAEEIFASLNSRSFDEVKAAAGVSLTPSEPGLLGPVLSSRLSTGNVRLEPQVMVKMLTVGERLLQIEIEIHWQSQQQKRSYRTVKRLSSVR